MKLLKKTSRYFIGLSSLIFFFGGILFYFLFQAIIDHDINNKLLDRKDYCIKQLERSDSLFFFQHYSAHMVGIKRVEKVSTREDIFSDTSIFDIIENKPINFRQLTFQRRIKNTSYSIQVRRSIVAHEEVVEGVVILEILLFGSFVLSLTVMNNEISKKIWQPFYFALDKITHYKVDLAQSMNLPRTSIDEFDELSTAIEKMSLKIHHEFNVQKEFSENASHEIQTPLAIIKNKLEILMQSNLTKEQIELVNSATVAAHRLSKLNEALIILSKIENRQFHDVVTVKITEVIDRIISGLDELIHLKSISVTKHHDKTVLVRMNPFLCEILLENLIVNSIKHNLSGGKIIITLNGNSLHIENTGEDPEMTTDKLFHRFIKSNTKSQSLGLGLSIVKGVCETYQFQLSYSVAEGMHTVSITFNSDNELSQSAD